MEDVLKPLLVFLDELLANIIKKCEERNVKKIDRCEVVGGNSNWQFFKNRIQEYFDGKEDMISLY